LTAPQGRFFYAANFRFKLMVSGFPGIVQHRHAC
jgi:hypothetical protein